MSNTENSPRIQTANESLDNTKNLGFYSAIEVINIDIKLSDAISILSCIGAIGSAFWAFKSAREAKT